MAESRATRVGRGVTGARGLVRRSSPKQRAGAGVAALLLVTAPFGGLSAAASPSPTKVRAGHTVDVGPYELTIRKIVTVKDLAPDVTPEKDQDRLIALVGTVRNPGTRPEYAVTLTQAVRLRGAGVVSSQDGGLRPELISYEDGQSISTFNPGLTYQVALVLEQDDDWVRQQVRVDVERLDFVHDDPLTLDADFWLETGKVAASGRFDVDVRP
jgi:hypothetical protein